MRKRIQVRPEFSSQIDLREAIGKEIARRAKHMGITYDTFYKEYPKAVSRVARTLVGQRTNSAQRNTASFFTSLYASVFGGEIVKDEPWNDGFCPDVVYEDDKVKIHTEIKSVSIKKGSPKLACYQFMNYSEDFFRSVSTNGDNKDCITNYAIFRYGKGNKNEKLYQYGVDGLVKRLSQSTRDLLVIPLNVLMPLLITSSMLEHDHSSSTGRDFEWYWEPLGGTFTKIHKSHEAVEELFQGAEDYGLSLDDLCIDDLEREEFDSPDNVYCRSFKIKPFRITRYRNRNPLRWARSFVENHARIFESFDGLDSDYFEYSSQEEVEEELEETSGGEIPF